ncbi:MAG: lipopolysaccharide transport periplasmic protein LptA [Steroidobacterales bacterium]
MASSILLSIASALALATGFSGAGAQEAAAPAPAAHKNPTGLQSNLPIVVEARSTEIEARNNRLLLHSVKITQGSLRVDASEAAATGLNFENSQWQLWGDVHIRMEKGSLSSDKADVTFANNQIARAVINGAPASFEQTLDDPPQTARGRANTIEYDVGNETVRLTQNAWLSDGNNELSGDVLVYDLRSERVVANAPPNSEGRVRITINPGSKKPEAVPPSPKQ